MSVVVFFVNVGVLFEGAFSLWVTLMNQKKKKKICIEHLKFLSASTAETEKLSYWGSNGVVLVSLLLTLNIFYTLL